MLNKFCVYRSESPSQIFLIILPWLKSVLQQLPKDQWKDVILSYDNMCHLDSMIVANKPLPLPSPYDRMWMDITKVRAYN